MYGICAVRWMYCRPRIRWRPVADGPCGLREESPTPRVKQVNPPAALSSLRRALEELL
jgi:hypothetical protein